MIANFGEFTDFCQTPHSNTGLNRQTGHDKGVSGHLDFLTICGRGDIVELLQAIWAVFGTTFDHAGAKPGTRGKYYQTILKSAQNVELAFNSSDESCRLSDFRLSVPGKPLQHVRTNELLKFCRYISRRGYRCTRFDWAIDDYDRKLCLDTIASECEKGNYKGANSHRYFRSQKRGHYEVGRTVYLGSCQSEKQVRIYDKGVESKGQIDSIRYEVQWRDCLAQSAFDKFVSSSHDYAACQNISNIAIGAIGFIERDNEVVSRCDVLPFWQDFVDRVGVSVKLCRRVVQTLLSDKKRWIESQVAGTIALITKCNGFDETFDWLQRIVRERINEMPSSSIAWVESWRDRRKVELAEFDDMMAIASWC